MGPPKTDGSWWRVLTKRGPVEKGVANHFSILALRTMKIMERQKDMALKDELPKLRNNSRKNDETEPKQKQHSVVDVTGDGSEV